MIEIESYTETMCAIEHVPIYQSRTQEILKRFGITLTYEVEVHVRHSNRSDRSVHSVRDQPDSAFCGDSCPPEIQEGEESPSSLYPLDYERWGYSEL